MKEKLLGSIVVSHYGPFTKNEAYLVAQHLLDVDPAAMCIGGTCKDGSEVVTVLSRHGDDPEMDFMQFFGIAKSIVLDVDKVISGHPTAAAAPEVE